MVKIVMLGWNVGEGSSDKVHDDRVDAKNVFGTFDLGAVREVIAKMLNYQAIERLSTLKEFQQLQLLNDVDIQRLQTTAQGPLLKYFTNEVHSYSWG